MYRDLQSEGFFLRLIRRASSEMIYSIVREEKDETSRQLDHEFEATVAWTTEPYQPTVTGEHTVAQRVREVFQNLRGIVLSSVLCEW